MRLIYTNKAVDATLSMNTGVEDSTYPLENMLSGELHPESRIQSGASGSLRVNYAFTAPVSMAGVLIAHSDATAGAMGLYRSSDGVSYTFAATIQTSGNYQYALLPSLQTYQYWRLNITGLASSTVYRFPELWLTQAYGELSRTHVQDSDLAEHGGSYEEVATAGGVRWSYVHYRQKRLPALRWELLSAAELAELQAVHDTCWPNGTLWIDRSIDGGTPDWLFVRYVSASFNRSRINPGWYSCEMAFEEVPEPNYEA